MSTIAFVMDIEEGHILPSFSLARSLRSLGHDVHYISVADNKALVSQQDFPFHTIFEHTYPEGFRKEYKRRNASGEGLTHVQGHLKELLQQPREIFMRGCKADCYIVSAVLRFDALIMHYLCGISPLLFSTHLRDAGTTLSAVCSRDMMKMPADDSYHLVRHFAVMNIPIRNLQELLQPLDAFPEIVACPRSFLSMDDCQTPNMHFLGPCMRSQPTAPSAWLQTLQQEKQIIYCSMGSQAPSFSKNCRHLFLLMIHIMQTNELASWHLVMSVSGDPADWGLPPIPPNVTILDWAPQQEVLHVASLAIVHGGLGSLRECIYYGVPMIVLPLGRDQPANARRVERHAIGMAGDIGTLNETTLLTLIGRVRSDTSIHANIRLMQKDFRLADNNETGIAAVEAVLRSNTRKYIRHEDR